MKYYHINNPDGTRARGQFLDETQAARLRAAGYDVYLWSDRH